MIHINHLETLTDLCGILKVRKEREKEREREREVNGPFFVGSLFVGGNY